MGRGASRTQPPYLEIIMSKSTSARVCAPRGIVAPVPNDAPLVPFKWVQEYMPHIGEVRLREVLKSADAPRPILGGGVRSRALWSRDAIVAYFDSIARSGKWPITEREVA